MPAISKREQVLDDAAMVVDLGQDLQLDHRDMSVVAGEVLQELHVPDDLQYELVTVARHISTEDNPPNVYHWTHFEREYPETQLCVYIFLTDNKRADGGGLMLLYKDREKGTLQKAVVSPRVGRVVAVHTGWCSTCVHPVKDQQKPVVYLLAAYKVHG